jgi:transposase-like protein
VIVKKRQQRLTDVDAVAILLCAKGLTTGEISAHFADVSRASISNDVEIRRVLFFTNAIESLNARYRRAVNAQGHFPTEQAALKTLYLVTRGMDPKGTGQARCTNAVEARPERVRRHLRRPHAGRRGPLTR